MTTKTSFRLLCVFTVLMLLATACGGGPNYKDKIYGIWESTTTEQGMEITIQFEFTKDGKVIVSAEGMTFGEGTYKFTDGDTLELNLMDEVSTTDIVELTDTKMTFKDPDGTTIELTKVK